jgi:acetyltransferase-like isoleucine patch superfamily enzyme
LIYVAARLAGRVFDRIDRRNESAPNVHVIRDSEYDRLQAGRPIFMPIAESTRLGSNVEIRQPDLVNLYGCSVGADTKIGAFVEIQKNAIVGARCKVSSHSFICEGVVIEDGVFIGHGVMFTNDRFPRATRSDGRLQTEEDWSVEPTRVKQGASIGSNATIIAGVTIGAYALVGAGAVVTRDVAEYTVVAGVPARALGDVRMHDNAAPTTEAA